LHLTQLRKFAFVTNVNSMLTETISAKVLLQVLKIACWLSPCFNTDNCHCHHYYFS